MQKHGREGDRKGGRGGDAETDGHLVVVHADIVQRRPIEGEHLAGDHVGGVEQRQLPARLVERRHRRLGLQQVLDHLLQHIDTGLAFELQRQPGERIQERARSSQPNAVVVLDPLHEAAAWPGPFRPRSAA